MRRRSGRGCRPKTTRFSPCWLSRPVVTRNSRPRTSRLPCCPILMPSRYYFIELNYLVTWACGCGHPTSYFISYGSCGAFVVYFHSFSFCFNCHCLQVDVSARKWNAIIFSNRAAAHMSLGKFICTEIHFLHSTYGCYRCIRPSDAVHCLSLLFVS